MFMIISTAEIRLLNTQGSPSCLCHVHRHDKLNIKRLFIPALTEHEINKSSTTSRRDRIFTKPSFLLMSRIKEERQFVQN